MEPNVGQVGEPQEGMGVGEGISLVVVQGMGTPYGGDGYVDDRGGVPSHMTCHELWKKLTMWNRWRDVWVW